MCSCMVILILFYGVCEMENNLLELYAEIVRTFDMQCQTSTDESYHLRNTATISTY